ncbi:hypothetical protein DUNSADRAFT_14335 [Dunaliella salina]|nr:hypothetical protein DUNSADRAFT_14335 [Dunaliella salina]|eukprot:KAF5830587.1 hypothetical protein DUNSADRAFT_14335 [Dunaliella salina]
MCLLRVACPHLTSLTIADKADHNYLLRLLAIPGAKGPIHLTSLHLSEGHGAVQFSTLASFLSLKQLTIHCPPFKRDASQLSKLKHLEDLTLHIQSYSGAPEGLEQVVEGCTQLTHFRLDGPICFTRSFTSHSLRHMVIKEVYGIQCLSRLAMSRLPAIESITVDQLSIAAVTGYNPSAFSPQDLELWRSTAGLLAQKHVRCSGVYISNVEIDKLLPLVSSLRGKLLHATTWFKCDWADIKEPCTLAAFADLLPELRVLELTSCDFQNLDCLSGVLTEVARMPHLHSLTVCPRLASLRAILPFPSHLVVSESLRCLTFECFDIKGGVLRMMSETFPFIQELNFRNCTFAPSMVNEANACFQYLRTPLTCEMAALKRR